MTIPRNNVLGQLREMSVLVTIYVEHSFSIRVLTHLHPYPQGWLLETKQCG